MSKKIILLLAGIILGTFVYLIFQNRNIIIPSRMVKIFPGVNPSIYQNKTDIPQVTVIAQDLDVPWAIAFLSDGRMLVTERPGRVRIVNTNGVVEPNPAAIIPVDTKPDGEGGLLGITLHPNFANNHFVYLYYTYKSSGNRTLNRVVRMKFENDKLSGEE